MITVTMYGRLGNHLWQYAVCRTIAEKKGYQFSIPRNFDNIFNCDLGVGENDIKNHFPYENCFDFVQRYDPNIFNIEDNTKLWGFFQAEKYILDNRENILKWFTLDFSSEIKLTENTCIINYRGGDYTSIPGVFLDKSYYLNSIEVMKNINPQMEFIVITDDIQNAKDIFPGMKIYHKGTKEDFYLVNKARYLIIANSTFSWWASWLNENAKLIIAPKYWLRPNIKKQENEWGNDWWSPSDSLTTRFHYLDRAGNLLSYEECLSEITEYNYLDHYKIDPLYENNLISNSYRNEVRNEIVTVNNRTLKEILTAQNINGFENKGGTDKETSHSYLETYERVLSKFKGKKPSILEIGVQYGGSSLLWHEYFDDSNLVMMDISDQRGENITEKMDPLRYKFHIGDAYNQKSLERIKEENPLGFDILMDDGPHTLESQLFFIENYIKLAKEGGVLIIEDIQDISHATILKERVDKNYKVEIVDLRSEKGRYDDIMIVVYIGKKTKDEGKFTIGWISHNPGDFNKFLGPSLGRIDGEFNTDMVTDTLKSSANYNILIERCKTKWIILCHEDVAFSGDILDSIKEAIEMYPDCKFFGFVGANKKGYAKSFLEKYDDLVTCDSCFIVLNLEEVDNKFDENTFDNYHLHVEDMCMQLGGNGKTILMNYLEPNEYSEIDQKKDRRWIHHGGTTYFKMGPSWGNYSVYKRKLNAKWNQNVPTT